jgi:hypothetical protein
MTTVGYGDVVPKTSVEKLYAMASMIITCGMFAYIIGSIGSIIKEQNAESIKFRDRRVKLNRYLYKHNLSRHIKFKVNRYLDYVNENQDKYI